MCFDCAGMHAHDAARNVETKPTAAPCLQNLRVELNYLLEETQLICFRNARTGVSHNQLQAPGYHSALVWKGLNTSLRGGQEVRLGTLMSAVAIVCRTRLVLIT